MTVTGVEDVWRQESAHVLGALLRVHPDLPDCEDAAQEALIAASRQWPGDGLPADPRAWLIRVAHRRLIDQMRADTARRRREIADGMARRLDETDPAVVEIGSAYDDSLRLMMMCAHPALRRPSQVAITLRCVGGLTTTEIAAAYLVPEATMGQRLSRARATLKNEGFCSPAPDELPERIACVLDVCHLIFNEGHTRTSGPDLQGVELTDEAIRLTRIVRGVLPEHDEATGLLALMLLTRARSCGRVDHLGDLVPLKDQDRSQWDRALIREGVALLEDVLPQGSVGRFQLQAAIAAVHAEAESYEVTDWLQINLLYGMLAQVAPSPAVTLNRAVAVAMSLGPEHGIEIVRDLLEHPAMQRHHRAHAVLAHLLEQSGDLVVAREHYVLAARLTRSVPEQRYLNRRIEALGRP
ncbi:sigma-70 family RNA polymerase sigma factor [Nocardioides sp.]|uniref:RNA polymerase sigma factor n=1 Tax=Nocardioides sp. TaxID=35761 RepID=UPI00199B9F29|nr:sigma-70 family RNA polymerase sigma factor [Nocardioides sp.]MBC7274984.1 sigma-70 family RNA polymerase sigma factor [Nocardioides sp.]